VHFYSTSACICGLDEDEIWEIAAFGGDEEPSAIGFFGEGGGGFEDAGLKVGRGGGDVYFNVTGAG